MSEYRAPTLTVDAVIFQLVDNQLSVLLVRRQNEPFKLDWALPGVYNQIDETTTQAFQRALEKKGGIKALYLKHHEQLFTFDTIARDPRGHAVSITYLGLGEELHPSTLLEEPAFFAINNLPQLAFDHADIIHYAHDRLKAKLTYTNSIFAVLPEFFTLTQLQKAYEAVLGRELDKRNFRKKFLSLNLMHETDKMFREGAHRPAKLYTFNKQSLESLSRSFD